MPSMPMTIRVFFRVFLGLAVLAASLADSCLGGAAQGIAPVQQPSDSPPIPGLAPVDGFQPFTSADALAAYNRANALAHKGDDAAARRQYDEAIELEPSNRSALVARCIAYRHLHDYGHAMDDCEEAIRLSPNGAQAHRERGVTRLLKADYDGAVADFTEAIRLFPKYSQAFNDRAATRFLVRAADETILPDLDEAIRLDPGSFDAHFNRAAIFLMLREWDRALDDDREAIRLRPNDAITYNNFGVAYRGKGDRDLAIANYLKALSLDPPGRTRQTIEANLRQYAVTGNAPAPSIEGAEFGPQGAGLFGSIVRFPPHAIWTPNVAVTQRFEDAIKPNPPDKAAFLDRGRTYIAKQDYDHAIAEFSEALRLDPDYREALNVRAEAYQHKGAYDNAIADFSSALRIDSRDPRARLGRCTVYYLRHEWDRVIADCSEVIRTAHDPGDIFGFHHSALSIRGDAYLNNGDDDRALQDYDEILRGRAIPARVLLNRGIIYLHKGDFDRAVAEANQAMKSGKYSRALVVRGQGFVGRREYGSAIQDFDEAIRLDPKSAAAFMGRGDAYEKQGDHDRAVADYRQALTLGPEDKVKSWLEPTHIPPPQAAPQPLQSRRSSVCPTRPGVGDALAIARTCPGVEWRATADEDGQYCFAVAL
jgi:tetratricopeptide (TPR) repeat protein